MQVKTIISYMVIFVVVAAIQFSSPFVRRAAIKTYLDATISRFFSS